MSLNAKISSRYTCIDISQKERCYGCGACVAGCPRSCIVMSRDKEGFDYPQVNSSKCIRCGKCRNICPFISLPDRSGFHPRPSAYASWNRNEDIRSASTSGGVFSALARRVIDQNGVIFGAIFTDNFKRVKHTSVSNEEELDRLRGSKYVQSCTIEAMEQISQELGRRRPVLFSGTPCQVAGLRNLLGSHLEGLLTCDFVCAGIGSPGVFEKYIEEQNLTYKAQTSGYCFRDKQRGWNFPMVRQSFVNRRIYTRWNWGDPFEHGLLRNVLYRPSCYQCAFASFPRCADITLADYWGVATKYPQMDDNKGTSLVLLNTLAGEELFASCSDQLISVSCDLDHAVAHNSHLLRPAAIPDCRTPFFHANSKMPFHMAAKVYIRPEMLCKRRGIRTARALLWIVRSCFRYLREILRQTRLS